MKKVIALLVVMMILVSSTCFAEGERGAARYTKLFSDYTWELSDYSYTYHNGSKDIYPNFKSLETIHLPNKRVIVTEDETGNTFITYTGYSGVYAVGELSISVDEKTIVVDCVSGELHGVFIYTRK